MFQSQIEMPDPTPEHMLNVLLAMIDNQEWCPMRHGEVNIYVWPNPVEAPPMVARMSQETFDPTFGVLIQSLYGLIIFGAVNLDGNVYFVTPNMINKLPESIKN